MLSADNIKCSGAASHYYERDNYYAKDSPEHLALSEWYGKGADILNLKGTVDSNAFKQVLDGKLPNGKELGRKEQDQLIHAPGLDLTFSAPKSVSIVAEVHGDTRVHIAHNTAVKRTLEYIEKNYIATRKMEGGELAPEATDNMIVAMFRHNTSRNLDPQLHTHCVLANATCREDGEWRSGYFRKIFEDKLYLGQFYKTELAYELSQLGFELRAEGKYGGFEIKDIPRSLIDIFSSRSKEIEEAAKGLEHVDGKVKAGLALRTRARKSDVDLDALRALWKTKLEEHNKAITAEVKTQTPIEYLRNRWEQFCEKFELKKILTIRPFIMDKIKEQKIDYVSKSLDYAIAHVSERQAVWEPQELIAAAKTYGLGKINELLIAAKINEYIENGILLISKQYEGMTSKSMLKSERQIVQYIISTKDSTQQICSTTLTEKHLRDSLSLTKGQKEAAKLILTSQDRYVAVQGYAGTGKTYMLETVKHIAEQQQYKLIGLAPSASATKTLEESTGIHSRTIHSFLYKYDGVIHDRGTAKGREAMRASLQNTIVIVDEASLASTNQMKALLKISAVLDFKVVLVGDSKQLSGVEAGTPFYVAQRAGIATAIMDETKRYTNDHQKAVVQNIIENQIGEALKKLEGNIIEPSVTFNTLEAKRECLANMTVVHWLGLDDKVRENTLITAPSNQIRSMINIEIREQLKVEGSLTGQPVIIESLKSQDLTQAQKLHIHNYSLGDELLFNKAYRPLGIDINDSLRVVNIKNNILTLQNEGNKRIEFDLERVSNKGKAFFEVYRSHRLELKVGDNMVWTRNFKDRPEVINSAKMQITNINDNTISYSTDGQNKFSIAMSDPILRHIDYGYAITAHAAQGRTYQNVIGVIESEHKHLTNQKLFYVTVSRAKESAFLITDNKSVLYETLNKQKGDALSAIEHQTKYAPISPKELLQSNSIKQQSKVMVYPEHNTKDIYHAIYNKLPTILPEFGFKSHGSYLMSSTEHKIDGSFGKKGKVYVYANNPGTIVDFTRGNISIWDYVKQNYMPAASNHEMMSYLCDMAGLSNTGYTIDRSAVEAKQNMFEAAKVEAEAIPQKTERELKLLSLVHEYASQKILDGQNKVLEYLQKERGYTEEQIKAMGLGAVFSKKDLAHFLKSNDVTDKEIKETYKVLHQIGKSHNLLIPYKDIEGKVQGFAGRNIEYQDNDKFGKYLYTKGLYKSSSLLNIDNLKTSGNTHAVVVEGMLDALSASANGIKNVIALGGTSCNYKQLGLLRDCGIKELTLCLDNDKAGREATYRLTQLVKDSKLDMTLKAADLPKTIKDPDQMIRDKGVKAFEQTIGQGRIIHEPTLPKVSSKAMNLEAEI